MSEQQVETKRCKFVECGREFSQGHRTRYRFERMQFCSQDCGRRGTANGPARGEFCRSGRHVLAGDNVRLDGRGKRSCKACQADRGGRQQVEPDDLLAVVGEQVEPDDLLAVVGEPPPPWRPAGWAATPNARGSQ